MLGAALAAGSSILGGILGANSAAQQVKYQREFAQNGIQWRVADAQKAGIHPLYALGANTISYSPVATGDLGNGIAQAGQDLGRAIDSARTNNQRNDAYAKTVAQLQVQRMGLENELLGAQIARVRQPANPPALPDNGDRYLVDGQGDSRVPAAVS